MAIRSEEPMSLLSIREVRLDALESTLSCTSTSIGELKSQAVSKNSVLDAAAEWIELPERRLRFAEEMVTHMFK